MPDANSCTLTTPGDDTGLVTGCGLGRLPLAILLDTGTLLAVGSADDAPPDAASVTCLVADRRVSGTWQAFAWPDRREADKRAFVAVVRAEQAVQLHAVPFDLCDRSGETRIAFPGIERLELDVAPLVAWLDRHGGGLSDAFDFISAALAADGISARCQRFLVALLTAISEHDGFIEIIAAPECGGILLQGWSMRLPALSLPVVVRGDHLSREEAAVAHFRRSDLLPMASGFVAYVRPTGDGSPDAIGQVFFRDGGRYHRLDVVEKPVSLEPEHVAGHLLDMMARLEGPPASIRAFKRVCRSRFPGHETVSTLSAPVRVACDVAVHVAGAGIFVSGWLLDPKRLVDRVIIKSTGGFYSPIENTLIRTARPDVSEGFRGDPLFSPCLRAADTQHGFMAFVPYAAAPAKGEVFYLELVLDDESCAFLPIRFHDGDPDALVQDILTAVDPDDPEIERLIGEHLTPLVAGLSAAAVKPPQPAAVCPFGLVSATAAVPEVSVVVPLGETWADFDINLSHFAADANFAGAELVVVAARSAAQHIAARLRSSARFYRLRGRLVLAATDCDRYDALALGAAAASSPHLLLLSPAVLPMQRGWLGQLLGEFAALPDDAALCPTLLYEDHSIRFAGSDAPARGARGVCASGLVGYAASAIGATATRPVWAGTLDCCCLRRKLFAAVGDGNGPYVNPQLKSLDFALRLKAAGGRFYWAPAITLYALDDEAHGETAHWQRVRRLVDERSFQDRWGRMLSLPADFRGTP